MKRKVLRHSRKHLSVWEERSEKKEKKKKSRLHRRSSNGIRLASRWKKGFFSVLFSRVGLILILLLIQILALTSIWYFYGEFLAKYTYDVQLIFVVVVLLALFNSSMDSAAKLSWMLLIAVVPLFGCIFYIWTRFETGYRSIRKKLNKIMEQSRGSLSQQYRVWERIQQQAEPTAPIAGYLYKTGYAPAYDNTETEFFPTGEAKFPRMLEELEKAEKFIFLEYFIIEEGYMWGNILEVLAEKVKQGVEVRVMYDGNCEFSTLPHDYPKRMKRLGISCKVWDRITPVLTSAYNYRDHRKILVIDGKTAFCGGINLADEYINRVERFGYWKDSAIMLKGAAVDSLTLMFLQLWNVNEKQTEDFSVYFNRYDRNLKANGFVIPYGDSPLNDHKIAERVYMDILFSAKRYVYIMTPYLILDDELRTALRYAAERGIDVRLIMPGIPDKKAIFALSKRHYKPLLEAGVKIYEFTPGFVHSKIFVSDDLKAVVGTINLDYRSLYHHFECAVYLHGTDTIKDIKADYMETLSKCRQVTLETIKNEKFTVRLTGAVLKLIAPLL